MNKIPKLSPRLESLENRLLLAVEHGLSATYFNSPTPGTSGLSRTDQVIDFYWGSGSPAAGVNSDNFSARWVGQLQPRYSETYTFSTRSDAGIRVWVDGKLIIDAWSRHSLRTDSGTIALQAGKRYDLKVEYWEYTGTAVARLLWASPSQAQEDVPASQLYAQGPMTNPAKGTDVLIQAEDFDLGNAGVAYADSDAGNTPGMYRATDVDIEATGDKGKGYDVGYARAGEWTEYSIDVATSGKYDLDLRMAAKGAGGKVHLEIDDVNVTGSIGVPNTGSWGAWTTVTRTGFSLTAGRHVLRFADDTAGSSGFVTNLNWLQVRREVPQAGMTVAGTTVTSGQATPVNFGTIQRGAATASLVFTVTNQGSATLTLGTPALPTGYTLVEGLSTTLAPGAADTFTVRLDSATAGTKAGNLSFATNDPARNPFIIPITGKVAAPQMAVTLAGATITNGQSTPIDFGTAYVGSTAPTKTFQVTNSGDGVLTLATPTLPAGFTMVEGLSSSIAAGASDTFTVALDTASAASRSGSLSLTSNDIAASVFSFICAGSVVATSSNPVLTPGSGFTGPTPQPAAVGSGAFVNADAIARWDVVPFQTFNNTFNVGVIAFHGSGIGRVDFSVNNGPWTPVTTVSLNSQTGAVEYWATLDASSFAADGAVEVRAIVYPNTGIPRVLGGPVSNNGTESLILYANGHGTLTQQSLYVATNGSDTTGDGSNANPYASLAKAGQMAASGAIIYLKAGTYAFTPPSTHNTNDRWITITAAPGVPRGSVIIQPNGNSLAINRLAVSGVTVDCTVGSAFYGWRPTIWPDTELWVDNCDISSSLGKAHVPEINPPIDGGWVAAYLTNSSIHDFPGRAIGSPNMQIIRNVQITNIGDDAIDNPQLVVNCTIDNVVANDPADHIDAIQYFPDHSDMNSIVFNVKATNVDGQLLFGGLLAADQGGPANGVFSNIAVVNFLGTSLQGPIANPSASQIAGNVSPATHLLFYNITLPNQNMYFVGGLAGGSFDNTVIAASVIWRVYAPDTGNVTISASHIIDFVHEQSNRPTGDFTYGDPGFISAALADGTYGGDGNFDLLSGSVLRRRVTTLLSPVDVDNHLRTSPGSIGAYAGL